MGFLDGLFKRREPTSREIAKERLQLVLVHDRIKISPALLDQIRAVLQDKKYVERLKRHYGLFRDAIEREAEGNGRQGDSTNSNRNVLPSLPRVGRNDPCPCGSGKKYKKCCLV